jgi:Ca2+-binding EF-hand superfamily protein
MKYSNRLMLMTGVVGMLLTAAPMVSADGGRGQMWQKADTNQDGAIDRAEFDAMRSGHFAKFDGDGNGIVTGAEIEAFMAARKAEKADVPHDEAATAKRKDHGARMLKRLDADNDGNITAAEWQASAEKRFARLDANSDGKIEQAEFPKRRKKEGDTTVQP